MIKDKSSLVAFRRAVRGLGFMKLQSCEQLTLAVCPVAKATGSLVPRAKREGKLAQYEADGKALRELVYGKGRGKGREGQWDAAADEFMADHPDYLEGFVETQVSVYVSRLPPHDALRNAAPLRSQDVVYRALGSQQYLKNPLSYCCPFENDKCRGHRAHFKKLNRINGLSNFVKHLETQHDSNPSALVAVQRLKLADVSRRLTSADLDAKVGKLELTEEFMQAQPGEAEQVRTPQSADDDFEVTFTLGSDEHKSWVESNKSPSVA